MVNSVIFKVMEIKVSSEQHRESMLLQPLDTLLFEVELQKGMGKTDKENNLVLNAEEIHYLVGRAELGLVMVKEEF